MSEITQLGYENSGKNNRLSVQKFSFNLNIFSIENGIFLTSSMTQVQNKIITLIMSCPACLGNFLLSRYRHFQTKSEDVGGTLDPSNP